MKKLLANLKLNAGNILTASDLVHFKGGACSESTCFACVQTAANITCVGNSNYSACVNNISSAALATFQFHQRAVTALSNS